MAENLVNEIETFPKGESPFSEARRAKLNAIGFAADSWLQVRPAVIALLLEEELATESATTGSNPEIGYVTEVVDLGGGTIAYNAVGPTMTAEEQVPRDRLIFPGLSYLPLEEEDPVLLARVIIADVEQVVIWAAQEVRGTTDCEEA